MKRFDVLAKSTTACAAALVIAGCGGGGGSDGGGSSAPAASVQLNGTAATGAALANASVSAKCVTGSGSATTDANGIYTLKLEGGALPCIIQVSGTQGGVAVTLHSLAEAGSTNAAVANVTPLTEMIVAQLSARLPAELFAAFGSGTPVSTETLTAATQAVLSALKAATGIDLGSIDPFKATLVAATTGAPGAGNAYDKLLDQLGDKIGNEALAQVVNQIAIAAAAGAAGGLGEVMSSVENGHLAGCPVAMSGKYRALDFFGGSSVRQLDFKAMKYNMADGQPLYDITADPAKPCEFVASGVVQGTQRSVVVVIGPAGIGAYRSLNLGTGGSSVGYIFPVQTHAASVLAGDWTFLQSGFWTNDGFSHDVGQFTFKADGKVDVCEYDASWASCTLETQDNLSVAARASDGGFDFNDGTGSVASMYGYRGPNGSLNFFGTTNAAGLDTVEEQAHFVLTRPQKLSVPAVGTAVKYWDVLFNQSGSIRTTSLTQDSNTVTHVNGSVVNRVRASDGRVDEMHYNQPRDGMRHRMAGTWNGAPFASIYQLPINGAGFSVAINSVPTGPSQAHIYGVSLTRP